MNPKSLIVPGLLLGGLFLLFRDDKPAPPAPDPMKYRDANGVPWELYQHKDGSWEATVFDVTGSTSGAYVKTYKAPARSQVISMIDGHALSNKGLL